MKKKGKSRANSGRKRAKPTAAKRATAGGKSKPNSGQTSKNSSGYRTAPAKRVREDDFSNVDSKRMHYKNHEVVVRFNRQNPDIAGGVHYGNLDLDANTGDWESCSGMRVLWHLTLTDGRKDD